MPKIINRKKQIENFILLAISFMAIFSILAGIIFWNYSNSIYENSDRAIQGFVEIYRNKDYLLTDPVEGNKKINGGSLDDYRAHVLFYDKNGEQLLNPSDTHEDPVTKLYESRVNAKFDTRNLDTLPQTIAMSDGRGYIRAQALKLKDGLIREQNVYGIQTDVKYVYIYVDATDNVVNLRHFQNLIMWSFGLAFVLAVMFAYFISRQNMKPILKAWDQQQDFVNNAAHELRTPMSVIQGKLETMLTKPESTVRDQSEAIILSLSEVRRLNSLTDNMLTLAKTGSNMTKIEKEETNINDFLQKIVGPYQEMAMLDDKNVSLKVDVNREVAIDQRRIHQLLVLLLDNALKYSDAGATIEVVASIERKRFILTVTDTGRGISAEAKKHIFDRFYREDKTGTRETGGTGLGLSIAEWIVQAHNGRITVSDNQPQGTIFKVSLPL